MKKWLVYFLLICYLTSFGEVRQLGKLPNLVGHFVKHNMADHNISVYAFFKMHYLDEQKKDKDYSEDMKLPFKTHDFFNSMIALNIPPEKTFLNFQHQLIYVDCSTGFCYSEKFYPLVFHKIWEPPKI